MIRTPEAEIQYRIMRYLRRVALLVVGSLTGITAACADRADDAAPESLGEVRVLYRNDSIVEVRSLALSPESGLLALVTSVEPFIHVFDTAGIRIGQFGRAGRGPLEMRNPHAAVFAEDGESLQILDLGRREILVAANAGPVLSAYPAPISRATIFREVREWTFGVPRHIERIGAQLIVGDVQRQVQATEGLRSLVVTAIDDSGATRDTIVNFADDTLYRSSETSIGDMFVEIPLWTTCRTAAEQVVIFDPARNEIRWTDAQGRTLAQTSVESARRELTVEEITTYLRYRFRLQSRNANLAEDSAATEAAIRRFLRQARDTFARDAPRYVKLLCDETGLAYLQEFDTRVDPRGYGNALVSIDTSGARRRLAFSGRFAPMLVSGGYVWGIVYDEDDVAAVGRSSIPMGR